MSKSLDVKGFCRAQPRDFVMYAIDYAQTLVKA